MKAYFAKKQMTTNTDGDIAHFGSIADIHSQI